MRLAGVFEKTYSEIVMGIFTKGRKARPASFAMMMLMLLAFSLKAFLPNGFMPEIKDGAVQIVICSGVGQKTISVPAGEADHGRHKSSSAEQCPYQVLTSAKLLSAPPVLFFHEARVVAQEEAVTERPFLISILAHDAEARGPPSVS